MDDCIHQARALHLLGVTAEKEMDYQAAVTYLMRAQRLHRELGNASDLAASAFALGTLEESAGNLQKAWRLYRESERLAEVAGDMIRLVGALADRKYDRTGW